MAQDLDSTKTAARPSHEAIESDSEVSMVGKTEQEKIDHIAMQGAKRAEHRIQADEETTPGNSLFTK